MPNPLPLHPGSNDLTKHGPTTTQTQENSRYGSAETISEPVAGNELGNETFQGTSARVGGLRDPTTVSVPATTLIQQLPEPADSPEALGVEVDSSISNGDHIPPKEICKLDMLPWRPSFLRVLPLMGLASLAYTGLQIFASYAVLAASNGDAVSNWKYQPTVYLATLTAISNKTLAFAAVQGAVVTFWLRVLRGTTLGQMHRDWSYASYVYKAIISGRKNFNLLALACICTTFVAVDGPLLQRASSVRAVTPDSNITLSVSLSPEIPAYFTGVATYETESKTTEDMQFRNKFLPVVREYISKAPMSRAVTGCHGKCAATVRGPALAVDHCTSELHFVNFSAPLPKADEQAVNAGGFIRDRVIFEVGLRSVNGTPEMLNFQTRIGTPQVEQTCAGPVNTTSCFLVSAIADYPVIIDNGILSLAEAPYSPKIVARANNTAITEKTVSEYGLNDGYGNIFTTLTGIAVAANYEFYTFLDIVPDATGVTLSGALTWFTFQHMPSYSRIMTNKYCVPGFSDPRPEVMRALNELVFRTGVYTALNYDDDFFAKHLDDGLQVHYNITGQTRSSVNVFHSDFHYFAVAAAVQLFTLLVTLGTFWDWWRLGRNTSFSPLEVAKAFDAPILRDLQANQSGRQIAKVEGERRVRYGISRQGPPWNVSPESHWRETLVITDEGRVDQLVGQPYTVNEYCAMAQARLPRRRHLHDKQPAKDERGGLSQGV